MSLKDDEAPVSDREPLDDDSWEDVPGPDRTRSHLSPSSPSPTTSARTAARRRRRGRATRSPQTPSLRRLPPARPPLRQSPTLDTAQLQEALTAGTWHAARYTLDVLSTALRLLRRPLAVLIFLWLLGVLFARLSHTFRTVFAPFCIVPGISRTSMCIVAPPPDAARRPRWADYPRLVDVQSTTFEQLLDEAAGGSGLSLEIKKAEMATTDLVTLVRVSDLRSRDVLASALVDFVEEARRTGRGLQKLTAKINGAVDSIMAVNDYALRTIEAANAKSSALSIIWPFGVSPPAKEVVVATFNDAMGMLAAQMERIILEAELSLARLERLEQLLTVLHELVAREDASLVSAKSELLSELWTLLGGNRRTLRRYQNHLQLLRDLGAYRARALAHVAAALQTLRSMSEDMEDLRERVAAPELVAQRIPVEVHMRSIRSGMERLREGRLRAKEKEEFLVRRVLGSRRRTVRSGEINVERVLGPSGHHAFG
ncbi:hypothetical protein A0H81_15035 [Grifola frondosa]|uniref:Uncharacterized protein n=1 Tax=Grifola frondosa TaxID=5627 RepID=A0A1C7LJK2_GRIFR|nr:hypothetical protein A0H81_15035 [Grifola frondosa]